MTKEKLSFQAEVSKLLDIVSRSLYPNCEIFLRELISNASDACDKLRYTALTNPNLIKGDSDFQICITINKDANTLAISDNGIGMNYEDLIENLGTIAHSGTQAFMRNLSNDAKRDGTLIGQFGVGFYSSFMVADKVTLVSRKAGEDKAWIWESDGKGEFTIEETQYDKRGTTITLYMNDSAKKLLEEPRIREIIKTYSDHIAVPIVLGDDKKNKLNSASALWARAKNDITEEQYKEFYHHVAHAFDAPWLVLHNKAEGVVEYTNLLYIPSQKPFDLFDADRKSKIKLYVKRVFVTDNLEDLLPPYLRFIRGVVDSEDLPLNVGRDTLQHSPILAKIRSGVVKKILGELGKKAEQDPKGYAEFWNNFGAVLKEGVYEDFANRDKVLKISRFRSTASEEIISLADYIKRMKEDQDAIYYITGENLEILKNSPQIEGLRAKDIEVLLLTDPIDEFWPSAVGTFQEKPFQSATRNSTGSSEAKNDNKENISAKNKDKKTTNQPEINHLITRIKTALGSSVKDVRVSDRLIDSAVCLVADDGDVDINLARLMRKHQRMEAEAPRILEINPKHRLIKSLANQKEMNLDDAAHLLLDQARIVEGEPIPDPTLFSRRISDIMIKGLTG